MLKTYHKSFVLGDNQERKSRMEERNEPERTELHG